MSGPQPASSADDETTPGILGNLPRTRPAVRSPRRADARPEPEAASAKASAAKEQAASPEPEPPPRTREQELEDLAQAGLSLAGGAATLGLRVAGRAAAALRGAVERK
jgi:hypothetical protein